MGASMTEKKKVWVRNPASEYALVESGDEQDRLSLHGWTATTVEPGPGAWVWLRRPDVEGAGRVPVASVPHWINMGWAPGAPEDRVDVTKDPEPELSLAEMSAAAEPAKPAPVGKPPKE